MFVCWKHVKDDSGTGCSGPGAQHSKGSCRPGGHEPIRFHQEGIGAYGGAPDHAGVVGTDAANQADPGKTERRASRARIAGCTMIVLDASVVVELLTKGAL